MKHKILAAAVVMMASAGAQANFNPDGSFDFGGDGNGNLVLSVARLTGDLTTSPFVNVSFGNVSDYLNNTVASGVVLDDNSALDSLIADAINLGQSISWNVVGIYNNADLSGFGLLTTARTAPLGIPNNYGPDISPAVGAQRTWMSVSNEAINVGDTAQGADSTAPAGAFNGHRISATAQGGGYNPSADLSAGLLPGEGLNFYRHFATDDFLATTGVADLDPLRDFFLTYDATNGAQLSYVAPVPLPAAAWLFASAVLGMVGVARRRAA